MQVNHIQLVELLKAYVPAKIVPLIKGSPGVGKSDVVKQVAKEYNLKVIDVRLAQCDPTDLSGLPTFVNGRATYMPMDTFPLEGDEVPEGYDGWLLFLDELTSANRAVQAASYKILLDRMVGQNKLHEKVAIICAGNLETDDAIVEELSTALQSRMAHIELSLNHEIWCDWAMDNGIDHRITDFIKFKPNALYTFQPDHTDNTYAAPRTWEFANRLMKHMDKSHVLQPMLAGVLSKGVAMEFITFCRIYESLPKPGDILKNPEGVPVPTEPSVQFAICGSIANNVDEENAEQYWKYIERLPAEFQMVCIKEALRRKPALHKLKVFKDWVSKTTKFF